MQVVVCPTKFSKHSKTLGIHIVAVREQLFHESHVCCLRTCILTCTPYTDYQLNYCIDSLCPFLQCRQINHKMLKAQISVSQFPELSTKGEIMPCLFNWLSPDVTLYTSAHAAKQNSLFPRGSSRPRSEPSILSPFKRQYQSATMQSQTKSKCPVIGGQHTLGCRWWSQLNQQYLVNQMLWALQLKLDRGREGGPLACEFRVFRSQSQFLLRRTEPAYRFHPPSVCRVLHFFIGPRVVIRTPWDSTQKRTASVKSMHVTANRCHGKSGSLIVDCCQLTVAPDFILIKERGYYSSPDCMQQRKRFE